MLDCSERKRILDHWQGKEINDNSTATWCERERKEMTGFLPVNNTMMEKWSQQVTLQFLQRKRRGVSSNVVCFISKKSSFVSDLLSGLDGEIKRSRNRRRRRCLATALKQIDDEEYFNRKQLEYWATKAFCSFTSLRHPASDLRAGYHPHRLGAFGLSE